MGSSQWISGKEGEAEMKMRFTLTQWTLGPFLFKEIR